MSHTMLMTRYIGRLDTPIPLATGNVCTLDNLRTATEIEAVANELIWRPSHLPRSIRLTMELELLHATVEEHDSSVGLPPTAGVDALHLARRIAQECIVIRYADDPADPRLGSPTGKPTRSHVHPSSDEDEDDVIPEEELLESRAYALSHVASLLISAKDADYWGRSFAYPYGVAGVRNKSNFFVDMSFAFRDAMWEQTGKPLGPDEHSPADEWTSWQGARDELTMVAPLVLRAAESGHLDVLQYAGETLEAVRGTFDPRFKLVLLVSIFEMLLTHNPDFRRFNVEDSISRQFLLKTAVLLHHAGYRYLELVKGNLKRLYDLRSAIAHGDFARVSKSLQVAKNRENARLANDVKLAYGYLRSVLRQFLDDPSFVHFLKAN